MKRKILKYLGVFIIGLVLLFAGGSWIAASKILAPANSIIGNKPSNLNYPIEDVAFNSSDGLLLKGWFLPSNNNTAIILLHGHKSNRLSMLARAKLLRDAGYGVMLYDARGCGESEAAKISAGYYESKDLLGCVDFLKSRGVTSIGCIGMSQGGATILLAAPKLQNIKFAICESAYDTMQHTIDHRCRIFLGLPSWLLGVFFIPISEYSLGVPINEISPVKYTSELNCPIFVISGELDTRVLVEDTMSIYNAAKEPKQLWLVPKARHQDLYGAEPVLYKEKILSFISQNMK